MKSGNLNFLEPSEPLQACNGIALPFNITSQLDATITNFIDNYNQLSMFRAKISPILRSTRLCLQQAASPVHYTTSCKHSLVLLRMGEIVARNMLS